MTISRREGRRAAVFMLYQADVTGQPIGTLYEGEVDQWAWQLVLEVTDQLASLDERITAAADEWTADRLGAVERNVLRVAIHELDLGEVPVEVAIDEAVTLAKRYGGSDEAGRLVNGILGRILKDKEAA